VKPLCIYHGNCADGFGAAWVVWKHFKGEVDFYPGVYQRPPPDVTGRDVIVVDFSYKRQVMLDLAASASSVLVLDHHKTAQEDLAVDNEKFFRIGSWEGFRAVILEDFAGRLETSIYTIFDMERSGAGITWDFFNPFRARPALINHIEDRDLWRFKLPNTRQIQAALFSYPYEFELWDQLINDVNMYGTEDLFTEGTAIERKHHKDIEELIEVVTRPMAFEEPGPHPTSRFRTIVPAANLPYTLTADAGHLLCERNWYGRTAERQEEYVKNREGPAVDPGPYEHPFAACYWDKPDGRQFSLRSHDDGADVGAIAKLYGGGGHAHAAGFRVPYSRLSEFEP
jgi:hypothetical protein